MGPLAPLLLLALGLAPRTAGPDAAPDPTLLAELKAELKAELRAELWAERPLLGPTGSTGTTPPPWRTIINAVEEYGCDPLRRSDSSPGMQRAVDAASKLPNGGSVYLPAGSYNMEGIVLPSNVDVFGDSRGRTNLLMMSTNATLFTVANSFNVRLRDLFLVGPQYLVPTAGALIHAYNAQGCQFTNLQLSTFFVGIVLNASTNCEVSFVKADGCYGPAMLQLCGTNMNGGGCYIFSNQFDSTQGYLPGRGGPSVEAGYGPWAARTAYKVGDVRSANGGFFIAAVGGTSAAAGSGPTIAPFANRDNTAHQIVDGTVRWQFVCVSTATACHHAVV